MDARRLWKIIGALGFVLVLVSLAWWGTLTASLPSGHGGEKLLRSATSCLYSSGETCDWIWHGAKASLPAYSPIPFWIGMAMLTIATILRFSTKRAQQEAK